MLKLNLCLSGEDFTYENHVSKLILEKHRKIQLV